MGSVCPRADMLLWLCLAAVTDPLVPLGLALTLCAFVL